LRGSTGDGNGTSCSPDEEHPMRQIEGVLLELGSGFAFVARQERMSVGKDDCHLICFSSTATCAG
jgi:predicted nuclease of restriction endonuclease-like (RecB) superfamily